jgi:hypothetical protein
VLSMSQHVKWRSAPMDHDLGIYDYDSDDDWDTKE